MPISYKNKIYTTLGAPTVVSGNGTFVTNSAGAPAKDYTVKGKSIVWNQLMDKSKFEANKTSGGVTFTNNGDGSVTVNGTATAYAEYYLIRHSDKLGVAGHKYFLCGCPSGGSYNTYRITASISLNGTWKNGFSDDGTAGGNISPVLSSGEIIYISITVRSGYMANNLIFKPKLFDLTQMFGAGNEPTTVAEFRAMFPDDYYSYNAGELKSIMPEAVETKNQSGETKRVNIPSSKYFPDGMKSVGSVYDEINFLSQKAIKRVGVRPYQAGDENNTGFITDKKNTVYALSTPVETAIAPPLQSLSTFKGFTSFSAPNTLTQNGPLSVTYYAEGGANPENGWLTSYKRKLYMGRNIEWNQLFTNSRTSSNGVTILNNQDGTMTLNGTTGNTYINFTELSDAMNQAHKYLLYLKIFNNPDNVSFRYGWLNRVSTTTDIISKGESCVICNQTETMTQGGKNTGLAGFEIGTVFNNVKVAVMVMDLTQMFGAGNEPTTPEEFWSYFDHKLYPYNAGETQSLFKISRKSQWGSVTVASLYVGEDIIIPQIVRN